MIQYKHIWTFRSYRYTDEKGIKRYCCEQITLLSDHQFDAYKIEEYSQYETLMRRKYELESFTITECEAFSSFRYADPPIDEEDT